MRRPGKIDPADPAALAAWLTETRTLTADLHALAVDAAARSANRRHARPYLREQLRRRFHTLNALLAALDPTTTSPS